MQEDKNVTKTTTTETTNDKTEQSNKVTNNADKTDKTDKTDRTDKKHKSEQSKSNKRSSSSKLAALSKLKSDDLLLRGFTIGAIILAMTIPTSLVMGTLDDRITHREKAIESVTSSWGDAQTLSGPLLVIPYYVNKETVEIKKVVEKKEVVERTEVQKKITDKDGGVMTVPVVVDAPRIISETKEIKTPKIIEEKHHIVLLPETLTMDFDIKDEIRKRGIFSALVYQTEAKVKGQFVLPDMKAKEKNFNRFALDEISLVVGLSDTRAIKQISELTLNGKSSVFEPGSSLTAAVKSGFHTNPTITSPTEPLDFQFNLRFNGSDSLRFIPWGRTTQVNMSATWPHPSFIGEALPESRDINADGFNATWHIPSLARSYSQAIFLSSTNTANNGFVTADNASLASLNTLNTFSAGVDLFEPVLSYDMVFRAIKYAILFIALTFLTCFIIERTLNRPIHYIQYAVIGLAVSLFYLCLLSLSEHMTFLSSYLTASTVIIGMITLYIGAIIRDKVKTLMLFGVLSMLYSALYGILKAEDFSLLLGTALLVFVTAALMLVTKRIHQNAEA